MKRSLNRWNRCGWGLVCLLLVLWTGCASKEEKAARHLEKAEQYIQQKEFSKAVIELKNVVQLNPKSDTAYYELGEVHLKLQQAKEAFQAFSRAASINPDNTKAQLKVGQILLLGRQTAEARKRAELILEKSPESVEGLSLLSGVQLQEKDVDGAIKTLEKAASVNPKDFGTQISLARLFILKGELGKAEKAYLLALSIDPGSHVPYTELSRIYGTRGEWEKAEAELMKMIQAAGKNYRNLSTLAFFYEVRKRWEDAEKTYLEAVSSAPKEDVGPLMGLAAYYARRRSYDQALETLKKATEIRKDDPDIFATIAQLHLDFNKIAEAEVAVDRILEKDKGHVAGNFLKGRVHFYKRDYANALERFDTVLRGRPNYDMAHYFKALSLIGKGDTKLAQQDLLKAVELNPAHLDARLLLAELYLRARDTELAKREIESCGRIAPRDIRVVTLQGNLKLLERDMKGAEEAYKKVVEMAPDDPAGHLRLGLIYNLTNRPQEAMKAFRKALDLNPMQIDALGLLVNAYLRGKKFDEALEVCGQHKGKVNKSAPALAAVEYLEGNIFLAKRDTGKALDRFKKAMETDPNNLSSYIAMAGVYVREKRLDEAITQYEAILKKNPKFLAGYMALGTIYDTQGNSEKAEASYRKALEINRDFAPAANNLAWGLAERGGNIDEALTYAQIAKEKLPKNAAVMDTLGWVYYLKGSYLNAIAELQDSVALDPENPVIQYHLGMALYKNKQADLAREHLEKALKTDQGFKGAEEARKTLKEIQSSSPK